MSKALSTLRGSRRFTLLLGIAVLLVLGVLVTRPPSAMAAVLKPQSCTYYSDGTYSVVVGWSILRCNGSIFQSSGTITPYRICESDYCCGSVWC